MAKTREAYGRIADMPTQLLDEKFVNTPGSLTEDMVFIPGLSFAEQVTIKDRLEVLLGSAEKQVFAVDARLAQLEDDRRIVVASGICPFPMAYNAKLNPSDGPGTARWYEAESGQEFVLPADINEAVRLITANPPPLSVTNLMKAGGIAKVETILIEEVGFYADWMLSKLLANSATKPTEEQEQIKERLRIYIREQYARNTRAFEKLRSLALEGEVIPPVVTVEDTATEYRNAIDEQVEKWRRKLPDGDSLDESGLRVAAYYSKALPAAYRSAAAIDSEAQLLIAEGAANLIVPDNSTAFNAARRAAFGDIAKEDTGPLLALYPSPSLGASLRKSPLEKEPVDCAPSSRVPDLDAYIKWPKSTDGLALTRPAVKWSQALPGSKAISEAQFAALKSQAGSDAEAELFVRLRGATREVLDEN